MSDAHYLVMIIIDFSNSGIRSCSTHKRGRQCPESRPVATLAVTFANYYFLILINILPHAAVTHQRLKKKSQQQLIKA